MDYRPASPITARGMPRPFGPENLRSGFSATSTVEAAEFLFVDRSLAARAERRETVRNGGKWLLKTVQLHIEPRPEEI